MYTWLCTLQYPKPVTLFFPDSSKINKFAGSLFNYYYYFVNFLLSFLSNNIKLYRNCVIVNTIIGIPLIQCDCISFFFFFLFLKCMFIKGPIKFYMVCALTYYACLVILMSQYFSVATLSLFLNNQYTQRNMITST